MSADSHDIQPIVIGTAGHIDHGKSTLVQRLTGTDPDRLKEEKERGLTIDLGFARMTLPDGRLVGIIDVPGHERFIRNMVAGASGIDMVMLVVAADDGVMPQTREHLSIMQLLGVSRGIVALTKIDLVDEEMVELAEEDVRETVEGTFLEGAPVQRVSAITGEGVSELEQLLMKFAAETEPRSAEGVFRMPVQRVFSARGFGTILTGIPISGSVSVGDVLEVLPTGAKGKVRGIQAYHEATKTARAGHSTALNLTDIDHKTIERGHVVATPGFFKPARMVGARLTALKELGHPVTNRMGIRVHTGTSDALGEVVILDKEDLQPGETGLVQLRMESPLVCAPGDPFVLRLASPAMTLGGGVILEENRYRLKRFKGFVLDQLARQQSSLGSPKELISATLMRAGTHWVNLPDLAVEVKRQRNEVRALLDELVAEGRVHALGKGERYIHHEVLEELLERVGTWVRGWFSRNEKRLLLDVRELRSALKLDPSLLAGLLDDLTRRGEIKLEAGGNIRLAGHEVALDEAGERLRNGILETLRKGRFQPPLREELEETFTSQGDFSEILEMLVDGGEAVHVGADFYLAGEWMEDAQAAVVENCERNGKLVIPELRDRLQTSRKFLIPILEYLDAKGITLRQAGHRVLKRR